MEGSKPDASRLDTNDSIKVGVSLDRPPSKVGRVPTRRRKIQERLAALDANNDGVISKDELEDCIEATLATEVQLKYVKWAACIMLVFLALLIAAVAGLTYGIVDSIKDTKSSDGALMDKGSSSTLRTASGSFVQPTVQVPTAARRRQLLAATGGVPVGEVPTSTVAQYCAYLAEGVTSIPTSPAVVDAEAGSTKEHVAVSYLQITSQKACTAWAAKNAGKSNPPAPSSGIEGTFTFEGAIYQVSCKPAAKTCTITLTAPGGTTDPTYYPPGTVVKNGRVIQTANSTSDSAGGRKLLQAYVHQAAQAPCEVTVYLDTNNPGSPEAIEFMTNCAHQPNTCGNPQIKYGLNYNNPTIRCDCQPCDSCFPGDALVSVRRSDDEVPSTIRMSQLQIGDKVLTQQPGGKAAFEDVYVFGHKDPAAVTDFVRLTIQGTELPLELSAGHFLPVVGAAGTPVMTRGKNVAVGDTVWTAAGDAAFEKRVVVQVDVVRKQGLFNPLTMGGTIVVNGMLASAHSEWFLDGVVPDRYAHHLPAIYQGVLAPARALYRVFGPAAARSVDASVDFAATGTSGIGGFAKAVALGLAGGVSRAVSQA